MPPIKEKKNRQNPITIYDFTVKKDYTGEISSSNHPREQIKPGPLIKWSLNRLFDITPITCYFEL